MVTMNEDITVPGVPVKAIDTVGAGDAFTAGLLTQLLESRPLAAAVRFANAFPRWSPPDRVEPPSSTARRFNACVDSELAATQNRNASTDSSPAGRIRPDGSIPVLFQSEYDSLHSLGNASDLGRFALFGPRLCTIRYREQVPDPMGIILKNDPDEMVIGTLGCFWSSKPDGVMELGYHIAEPYWVGASPPKRREAMVDHAFENYPVDRINSRVFAENVGRARVALKLE